MPNVNDVREMMDRDGKTVTIGDYVDILDRGTGDPVGFGIIRGIGIVPLHWVEEGSACGHLRATLEVEFGGWRRVASPEMRKYTPPEV